MEDEEYLMGVWKDNSLIPSMEPMEIIYEVEKKEYGRSLLYVSSTGTNDGMGTKDSPLDIYSAIRFSKPGTTIILEEGVYEIKDRLKIERGNSGVRGEYKTLIGEGNVVLDFSSSSYGMEIWGDYWILSNFTIQNTMDGKKGLQIAGNNNIVQ